MRRGSVPAIISVDRIAGRPWPKVPAALPSGELYVRLMPITEPVLATSLSAPTESGSSPNSSVRTLSKRSLSPGPSSMTLEPTGSELSSPRGSHWTVSCASSVPVLLTSRSVWKKAPWAPAATAAAGM